MNYYMIICHRGHCGSGKGTEIKFAMAAENLIEACENARRMPGVKHSRMVISGKTITQDEYETFIQVSAYARSVQFPKRIRRR